MSTLAEVIQVRHGTGVGSPLAPSPLSTSIAGWAFSQSATWTELPDEKNTGSARPVRPGVCLSFDGTDDYISLANSSAPTNMTVCLWVKTTDTTEQRMVQFGNTLVSIDAPGTIKWWRDLGQPSSDATGLSLPSGTWYHVAVVHDGNDVEVFVDGASVNDDDAFGAISTTSLTSNLGAYNGASHFFDGTLRDVRIYSRALTSAEVLEVFQNASGQPLDTLRHWKLEEESGTTAYDSSGNASHGTLTGPTWTEDGTVAKSWANDVGYTLSGNVLIPRSEANTSLDASGGSLQYSGVVPKPAKFRQSNCVSFDGVDDGITLASEATYTNASYSVRFSFDSVNNIVLSRSGSNNEYIHIVDATTINVQSSGAGAGGASFTVPAMSTGTWYHVVVTKSGSNYRLYLDGVESSTGQVAQGADFRIGSIGEYDTASFNWDGEICDVRIYNLVLSASQAESIYNQDADQPIPDVSWYPLAEGAGSTSYNVLANSNHGTHSGSPSWALQNSFHYNVVKGFRDSAGTKIPALNDGSTAAEGSAITNASVIGHNDAETLLDFQSGEPSAPYAQGIPNNYAFGDVLPGSMSKRVVSAEREDQFTID